ncbi:haloacid dehalogenase [Companilactobacillus sp. RD055328]|uniref:Cof-type HAD-IIB family hydrolase n=1 Tax=Companilactobacillus sp. RD055328 TaxID=2916634 RepID=UPI001FC8E489|nr:Cof-type HAD-IIB family hydrolase [Companilactobacillus sp. RD055328]GKQ42978.1 haloacid dehalogenase [Companilactobacillus sp. RD055328]
MDLNNLNGVVFFDLDGTLLNDESKITDEVAAATEQLKVNNILPVICTGRSPHEITHTQEMTNIDTVITLNGSLVKNGQNIIYQRIIPTDLCEQVLKTADESGEAVAMYNNNTIAATTDKTTEFIETHHLIAEPMPPINPEFYQNNDINMMVIYTQDSGSSYNNKFSDHLKFYKTGLFSLDCVMKEESKKTGIIHLLEELGLSNVPTYAFGDGPNDIEMLDYVDHAVVMGNAREDIFSHAEFITTKNTDSGIFNGLKHYNLI